MPVPLIDLAIAGIGALGNALVAGSQPEGTKVVGRPTVAFSAQDQARKAISDRYKQALASENAPVMLPNIDVSGLGGMTTLPGLDIPLGINPQIAGLGTADFFGAINANRALRDPNIYRPTASNEEPPGQQPGAGRGRAGEMSRQEEQDVVDRYGESVPDLGTPGNPRTGERTTRQYENRDGTLNLIGQAIQELLDRTDVSQTGPKHFDPQTLLNT